MNTTYGVLNNSSLIIDTDKLRENVRTILRSLPAGTKLIPVVKDDAYGMGMVGVARTLSAFPEIGCLAVANVSEGVTLRREGIRQDILIMGSTLPFQYAPAVECDLTVTVSRLGMVPELAEVCKAQSKPLNVQIKLETGMHRIGVEPGEELAALIVVWFVGTKAVGLGVVDHREAELFRLAAAVAQGVGADGFKHPAVGSHFLQVPLESRVVVEGVEVQFPLLVPSVSSHGLSPPFKSRW